MSIHSLPGRHPAQIVYTNNAVKSVNMNLRNSIKNRSSLPTEELTLKLGSVDILKNADVVAESEAFNSGG